MLTILIENHCMSHAFKEEISAIFLKRSSLKFWEYFKRISIEYLYSFFILIFLYEVISFGNYYSNKKLAKFTNKSLSIPKI
jgi:hypothetical protein